MPRTQIPSSQVKDGSINRDDIDTSTAGKALIAKLLLGSQDLTINSTGADSGTGDVTLDMSGTINGQKIFANGLKIRTTDGTNPAQDLSLLAGAVYGSEVGFIIARLLLSGGRFDMDALSGKCEFRFGTTFTQFNMFAKSGSKNILTINYSGSSGSPANTALDVVLYGGLRFANPVTVTASTYTITAANRDIYANCASNNETWTLPSAVTYPGIEFFMKKIDASANSLTINTVSSQIIDSAAGVTSVVLNGQNKYIWLKSDGAGWQKSGGN